MIFYGSAVYGMICFGVLAKKWPKLMQQYEAIEGKMPKYRTQREKRKMAHKVKMIAFIVLMSSLGKLIDKCKSFLVSKYFENWILPDKYITVEHSLTLISTIHFSKNCLHQKDPFEELFKVQLSQLFTFVSYSSWVALVGKFVNITATFSWNYMDLFVMVWHFCNLFYANVKLEYLNTTFLLLQFFCLLIRN